MTGIVTKSGDSTVLNSTISYNSPSNTATSTQVSAWNNGVDSTYYYTYDDAGNITSISGGKGEILYSYNELNQLIYADVPATGRTLTFSYDDNGNILKRSSRLRFDKPSDPPREVSYVYGDSDWPDLLTAHCGTPITYDEIGNPLDDWTWTYTWQHGRQLVGMENEETSISYAYNTDGQRISKTVDGTTYNYYYLGDQLVEMAWGTNRMHFTYDAVGPLSVNFNGTEYFYLKNGQRDVTGLVDSTGAKVVQYTYDTWGEVWTVSGSLSSTLGKLNPFRYRSYVYDNETGLYYLNSRYYNPVWGRFINADGFVSTGQGISGDNMFAYCGNNPVNRYDPSGNAFLGIMAGAALLKLFIAGAASCLVYIGFKSIVNNPPASPPITIPKFEFKSKTAERAKEKEKSSSPVLPKKPKDPVHHIVAKADPRAAEARQILRDVGIEPVTDLRNLVVLPAKYHASLHTTAYHNYVTERLRPVAGDRVGIELVLASLKAEIVARSAVGIRWD